MCLCQTQEKNMLPAAISIAHFQNTNHLVYTIHIQLITTLNKVVKGCTS